MQSKCVFKAYLYDIVLLKQFNPAPSEIVADHTLFIYLFFNFYLLTKMRSDVSCEFSAIFSLKHK